MKRFKINNRIITFSWGKLLNSLCILFLCSVVLFLAGFILWILYVLHQAWYEALGWFGLVHIIIGIVVGLYYLSVKRLIGKYGNLEGK